MTHFLEPLYLSGSPTCIFQVVGYHSIILMIFLTMDCGAGMIPTIRQLLLASLNHLRSLVPRYLKLRLLTSRSYLSPNPWTSCLVLNIHPQPMFLTASYLLAKCYRQKLSLSIPIVVYLKIHVPGRYLICSIFYIWLGAVVTSWSSTESSRADWHNGRGPDSIHNATITSSIASRWLFASILFLAILIRDEEVDITAEHLASTRAAGLEIVLPKKAKEDEAKITEQEAASM